MNDSRPLQTPQLIILFAHVVTQRPDDPDPKKHSHTEVYLIVLVFLLFEVLEKFDFLPFEVIITKNCSQLFAWHGEVSDKLIIE